MQTQKNVKADNCQSKPMRLTKRMYDKQYGDKLKPVERRLKVLDEHIKQADIYREHKGKKAKTEAKKIIFTAAKKYITDHLNGHDKIPYQSWKAKRGKLTAEQKRLNAEYFSLKNEVKEVDKIRRSVDDIMREEQRREQPKRTHDMEL